VLVHFEPDLGAEDALLANLGFLVLNRRLVAVRRPFSLFITGIGRLLLVRSRLFNRVAGFVSSLCCCSPLWPFHVQPGIVQRLSGLLGQLVTCLPGFVLSSSLQWGQSRVFTGYGLASTILMSASSTIFNAGLKIIITADATNLITNGQNPSQERSFLISVGFAVTKLVKVANTGVGRVS